MTWVVEDCVKLPFFLSVPPLRPGQTLYKIVGITPSATGLCALKLLVYAALSYECVWTLYKIVGITP